MRDLSHENIIDFHSFIITPSYALISMAHHPRLMPVELPESKARSYFQQLISAVDFLHAHGTTHNDLKPANILLSVEDKPILVDFGFAQQYDVGSKDRFLSSLSWGTPEYLSPERAKGILHDERLSDTWALGVSPTSRHNLPSSKSAANHADGSACFRSRLVASLALGLSESRSD